MQTHSITLDCAPGRPRGKSYIQEILTDTKWTVTRPVSEKFGETKWEFNVSAKDWAHHLPKIEQHLQRLYNQDFIRFASWQ